MTTLLTSTRIGLAVVIVGVTDLGEQVFTELFKKRKLIMGKYTRWPHIIIVNSSWKQR